MAREKQRKAEGPRTESTGGEVDRLFQLPLDEFTEARDALVAKLKKDGEPEKAKLVKGLTKPSISAWVANQLYWRERKALDRLLAAGEQFRAHAAQQAGNSADIRATLAARREALTELSEYASAMLRDAGHATSRETMRRVTTTLEALATYGESPEAPTAGRLTADVDPPGFEVLAALVPRSSDSPGRRSTTGPISRPEPKEKDTKDDERRELAQHRARLAELREAVDKSERAVRDARRKATAARDKAKTLATRAKDAEKRRATLEKQFEKAKAEAESARQDADEAVMRAEQATQAADDAQRAVRRAREALKEV